MWRSRAGGTLLVLLGIVGGVVAVELLLQAGAAIVWWRHRDSLELATSGAPADSGRTVVLCAGDSYTWGIGANPRTTSYPRHLERALREADGDHWEVQVAARPGLGSRALLARLPTDLESHRPQWVCLLVGANDRWADRFVDEAPEAHPAATGWVWRWRIPRLLALARRAWLDRAERAANAEGGADSPATARGGAEGSGAGEGPPADLRTEIDRLRGLTAVRDKRPVRERAIALIPFVRETGDEEISLEFVRLLRDAKLPSLAATEAEDGAARYGRPVRFGLEMAHPLLKLGQVERADSLTAELVRLEPDNADCRRMRGRVLRAAGDLAGGLREDLLAFSLDGDEKELLESSRIWNVNAEDLDTLFASDAELLAAGTRERVSRIVEDAVWDREMLRDIRVHVVRAVDLVRRANARPVILTYPTDFALGQINTVLRDVARELDVPVSDTVLDLQAARRERTHRELYSADAHCTAEGYRIMAGSVARRLLELNAERDGP